MLSLTLSSSSRLRSQVQDICAELFDVVQCLSDLLVRDGCDGVQPLGHESENLLLSAIRLLHLDNVADYVLSVLHVHLEKLDCLALGLHFLQHLLTDYVLEVARPVVVALLLALCHLGTGGWEDHAVQEDLHDDQQVLVREEHQVLEARVDARLGS